MSRCVIPFPVLPSMLARAPEDYGHHLNAQGRPMCRLCRVARLFGSWKGNQYCSFCKRIKLILARPV